MTKRPCLVVCLTLIFACMCQARPTPSPQPRNLKEQIRLTKEKIETINQQEQLMAAKLQHTRLDLTAANDKFHQVQAALADAKKEHQKLRAQVRQSRQALAKKRHALGQRLREIELEGNANYLEVLFQARQFTDFIAYGEYIQRMLTSERDLIASVNRHKQQFELHREALQRTVNEIDILKDEVRHQIQHLEKLKSEQDEAETELHQRRQRLESQVVALEHLSLAAEKHLQGLLTSQAFSLLPELAGSGQFQWPVNAPITSPFGYRIHPIYGTGRFHSGLDLGAGFGTPIQAADHGVVVYSDWCGGYGQCVILQHGKGLTTLYGHCSKLLVHVGQQIRKGQVVAEVGSTGASTGPHLHFEVRQDNTAVDPRGFL